MSRIKDENFTLKFDVTAQDILEYKSGDSLLSPATGSSRTSSRRELCPSQQIRFDCKSASKGRGKRSQPVKSEPGVRTNLPSKNTSSRHASKKISPELNAANSREQRKTRAKSAPLAARQLGQVSIPHKDYCLWEYSRARAGLDDERSTTPPSRDRSEYSSPRIAAPSPQLDEHEQRKPNDVINHILSVTMPEMTRWRSDQAEPRQIKSALSLRPRRVESSATWNHIPTDLQLDRPQAPSAQSMYRSQTELLMRRYREETPSPPPRPVSEYQTRLMTPHVNTGSAPARHKQGRLRLGSNLAPRLLRAPAQQRRFPGGQDYVRLHQTLRLRSRRSGPMQMQPTSHKQSWIYSNNEEPSRHSSQYTRDAQKQVRIQKICVNSSPTAMADVLSVRSAHRPREQHVIYLQH